MRKSGPFRRVGDTERRRRQDRGYGEKGLADHLERIAVKRPQVERNQDPGDQDDPKVPAEFFVPEKLFEFPGEEKEKQTVIHREQEHEYGHDDDGGRLRIDRCAAVAREEAAGPAERKRDQQRVKRRHPRQDQRGYAAQRDKNVDEIIDKNRGPRAAGYFLSRIFGGVFSTSIVIVDFVSRTVLIFMSASFMPSIFVIILSILILLSFNWCAN